MEGDTRSRLEQLGREVKELKQQFRDSLYGAPEERRKGLVDRIEKLEEHLHELTRAYDIERVEAGTLARLEDELDQLKLDYRVAIVYLRGIAAAVATITITLIGAAGVGILRFFASGAGP